MSVHRQIIAGVVWGAIYITGRFIGRALGIDPSFEEAALMIIVVTAAVVAQCAILW